MHCAWHGHLAHSKVTALLRESLHARVCYNRLMGEGTSLVNLGELSKPATVLIEKIAEAVCGVCHPFQIKRVAKAEAEAALIRAKGDIKITDLHRRAVHRFFSEEAKKQ